MEVAALHGASVALSDQMLREAGLDCVLLKSGMLSGPRETQIRGRKGSLTVWLWHNHSSDSYESGPLQS
jgi:adenylate cyclase